MPGNTKDYSVNNDTKPRDNSGLGSPKKNRDSGSSPKSRKSVADGANNSQGTDKVKSRNK